MIDKNNISSSLDICQHCSEIIKNAKFAYVLTLINMENEKDRFSTYQFINPDPNINKVVAVAFHNHCWNEIAGKRYSFDVSNVKKFSKT